MIIRYAIDASVRVDELRNELIRNFKCESTRGKAHSLYYLDTLDWRLYGKGYQLEAVEQGKGMLLELKAVSDGELVSLGCCATLPNHTDTLPEGKLRDLLYPVLQARALVKQLTFKVRRDSVFIMDKNHKSTANLLIETAKALHPELKPKAELKPKVFRNLYLEPMKGYEKQAKSVQRFLKQHSGLELSKTGFLSYCLACWEIDIHRFNNKLSIALDPEQRSDMTAKSILLQMTSRLEVNRQPIIDDIDSECLHDFRIAIRRTRVALQQLPGLFPVRKVESFSNQFKKLGALTTGLRDLDVILQEFGDYTAMAPGVESAHLQSLKEYLSQERNRMHTRLSHFLVSPGYSNSIFRWKEFLNTPPASPSRLKNAEAPIGIFIAERTWKNYQKVLRKGRKITEDSKDRELHELRKECKKLRYLLEFGRSLYPVEEFKMAVKIMKKLQDVLGEFQDYSVHIALFTGVSKDMAEDKCLSEGTASAIEMIVRELNCRKGLVRRQFEKAFERFASNKNQKIFAGLLAPIS